MELSAKIQRKIFANIEASVKLFGHALTFHLPVQITPGSSCYVHPEGGVSRPICHHLEADNPFPCCGEHSKVVHLMAGKAVSVPTESHQGNNP